MDPRGVPAVVSDTGTPDASWLGGVPVVLQARTGLTPDGRPAVAPGSFWTSFLTTDIRGDDMFVTLSSRSAHGWMMKAAPRAGLVYLSASPNGLSLQLPSTDASTDASTGASEVVWARMDRAQTVTPLSIIPLNSLSSKTSRPQQPTPLALAFGDPFTIGLWDATRGQMWYLSYTAHGHTLGFTRDFEFPVVLRALPNFSVGLRRRVLFPRIVESGQAMADALGRSSVLNGREDLTSPSSAASSQTVAAALGVTALLVLICFALVFGWSKGVFRKEK